MTTSVKVEARLSDTKEVKVVITAPDTVDETYTLQNGEVGEYYVYDDREISVKEVEK